MATFNNAQYLILQADILANTDPEFVTYRTNGQNSKMADWYNTTAAPDYTCWKNKVTQDEIMQNGFDWVRVDNLTVGKARIWEWLFANETRSITPSKANVRAGIAEVWKGTAADLAVQAVVLGHCKRLATRVEKLFAVGTGTTLAPSDLVIFGPISELDVANALLAQ